MQTREIVIRGCLAGALISAPIGCATTPVAHTHEPAVDNTDLVLPSPEPSSTPSDASPAPQTSGATPPEVDPRIEACFLAAQRCAEHARVWNAVGMVDCMPTEMVMGLFGSTEIAVDKVSATKPTDATIESANAMLPTEMHATEGGRVYAILPQRVVVRRPDARVSLDSFLVGVSNDSGVTWKFVDGTQMTKAILGRLFPDFPPNIDLPPVGPPTAIAD